MRAQTPQKGTRGTLYGQGLFARPDRARKLRRAEGELSTGSTIPEVARELGISEATFHRWKKR